MSARLGMLGVCVAIGLTQSLASLVRCTADEPPAIAGCCEAAVVPIDRRLALADAPAARVEDRHAPKMKPDELLQLRLPDVRITAAEHHAANEPVKGPFARPVTVAYTAVQGKIGGTIGFELLLPDEWNGRFVMGGGGGFVGTITNMARDTINRNYATVGTDSGHQWPSGNEAGWALDNMHAQVDFGHLAVHRTAEVARAIITADYAQPPKYSYFMGCSSGGGQALMEAQRYPDDFDGIVSAAPVVSHTGLAATRLFNSQNFFPDPKRLDKSIVPDELLKKLHAEVIRVCDEQDGVKDGVLDDPRLCRFDLSQMAELTPEQRRAIQGVYDGPRDENGQIHPGMPLGCEDQWPVWKSGSIAGFLAGGKYPNPGFSLGIEFCKYFVFNDPKWDYSRYDLSRWRTDAHRASTFVDANNPELGRFKARGGRLILWHGWIDGPLTPLASIQYFEEVERRDATVRDYFRLYLLPGVMHCSGGNGPDRVDWLTVVRQWVEEGVAPERLVASKVDNKGQVMMTRPVHPYPLRAVYKGTGDTSNAENFVLPGK